jgi:ATP-binding cassette subfamily F protein uup
VIEARDVSKSLGGRSVVRDFSLRVMRGERVAFVGPNGAGKTTLLKLLTGEIAPDAGSVTHGTKLEIAVFDQARERLDGDASLWDSLTLDPRLGVSGASDQVMVRGTPRHVAGYLKDFLFDDRRLRAPVSSLSGGEKARLLLARLMALPSNLLVLDEPTNDLDVETLDLLQEVLGDYEGTVLLVSHDRDFLDRVATSTVAPEGGGRWRAYPGGWSDYASQRPVRPGGAAGAAQRGARAPADGLADRPSGRRAAPTAAPRPAPRPALSFTEAHRLEALPGEIERLTAEAEKLSTLLSDPDLFTREPAKFRKATEALAERQARIDAAEEEWLTLAEKAEGAA